MADKDLGKGLSRRSALTWIAAAPAVAAAGGAVLGSEEAKTGAAKPETPPAPTKPSPYARFVAKDEKALTGKERDQLLKQAPGLEGALKKLREFDLGDAVEPAINFLALRSPKGGRP